MSVQRREFLVNQDNDKYKAKLLKEFKRKYVKQKVTPELKAKFLEYLWTMCEAVVISPNAKDTRMVDGVMERKFHYYFSQRELYDCCCKDPSDGGFAGFRHPKDPSLVWISRSSFEKMLPSRRRWLAAMCAWIPSRCRMHSITTE